MLSIICAKYDKAVWWSYIKCRISPDLSMKEGTALQKQPIITNNGLTGGFSGSTSVCPNGSLDTTNIGLRYVLSATIF